MTIQYNLLKKEGQMKPFHRSVVTVQMSLVPVNIVEKRQIYQTYLRVWPVYHHSLFYWKSFAFNTVILNWWINQDKFTKIMSLVTLFYESHQLLSLQCTWFQDGGQVQVDPPGFSESWTFFSSPNMPLTVVQSIFSDRLVHALTDWEEKVTTTICLFTVTSCEIKMKIIWQRTF